MGLLLGTIVRQQGRDGPLARAIGRDWKGKLSPVIYLIGLVGTVLLAPLVGLALYTLVALLWLVPDRRLERYVREHQEAAPRGL